MSGQADGIEIMNRKSNDHRDQGGQLPECPTMQELQEMGEALLLALHQFGKQTRSAHEVKHLILGLKKNGFAPISPAFYLYVWRLSGDRRRIYRQHSLNEHIRRRYEAEFMKVDGAWTVIGGIKTVDFRGKE